MNSASSFRSIFMVASCAGAALGCYLVSLRVASERSALEDVENRIVLAQRDVRTLQTEIGTRGRLSQLERWNVRVLALSAPSADQFLDGSFELAKLVRPQDRIELEAPVVLASAPVTVGGESAIGGTAADENGEIAAAGSNQLLHQASLKVRLDSDAPAPERKPEAKPVSKPAAPIVAARRAAEPAKETAAKPRATPAVDKKSTEKKEVAAARPVTRGAALANADPLAPLPDSKHRPTRKDTVSAR